LIASQTGGGTPSRQNPAFWRGPIPWASVKDFAEGGTELLTTEERISQQGLQASATNLIPANTPIVCTRMAVGRVAIAPMEVAINQDLKALTPARGVSTRYLLRLADYAKPKAESVSVGSTVKGIKVADYLNIQVPLAPLPVQPKIAEVLDTLDAAIRGTEAVVAKLRAMKQGLLHDLLTRGIDANGDLRPPHPEAPHLYHQTPLGWLPKEWDAPQIFEVGEVVTGRTPPAEDPSAWGEDTPFVTPGDIAHGQMVSRSERSLSESGKKYVPTVRAGATSVVCIGSTIGKVGYLARECAFNQQINAVVPSAGHVDAFIFSSICRSIGQLGRLAGLQAVPIVNKREFQKIRIAACSKTEQAEISLRLSVAEHREAAEVEQLKKLIAAKSGLMDDLLTGRVPATPLL
jgi:type I restriction enzyme S subunit